MKFRSAATLVIALALTACSAPSDSHKSMMTASAPVTASALVGHWQWLAASSAAGRKNTVNPERYWLEFQPGGVLQLRADCNQGSSSYQLTGDGIRIDAPGLTKMGCGPESQDREFIAAISQATRVELVDGELRLELTDGRSLIFAKARP
jgi:heat shock protein HslJ